MAIEPDNIRKTLADFEERFAPFVILTRGGREYPVIDRNRFWLTDAMPDVIIVILPNQGIHVVRIDAIDAINLEREPATL